MPVVRLSGVIRESNSQFAPGLSIASTAGVIQQAFSVKKAKAVAVVVNSPGGSPVQSRLIMQRIRQLADEKDKKVYVFMEDVAASGGYFISLAGDEIYCDPSSIVGSIGVISAGFGFVEAIDKLGVSRRVYTAGKNKSTLDPFLPEKADDIQRIKDIQLEIHQVFIDHVKAQRGEKLTAPDDELFTGEFWVGETALKLGLVDGISDIRSKMREVYGEDVRLNVMQPKRGIFGRRQGVGVLHDVLAGSTAGLPQGLAADMMTTLEDRALWARYGL